MIYKALSFILLISLSNGRRIHPKRDDNYIPPTPRKHDWKRKTSQLTLPTRQSHQVTSLPLLKKPFKTNHYAGYIPTTSMERQFFYWLFEPDIAEKTNKRKTSDDEIPLLVWLNGGPGCTSLMGLFIENGPLKFNNDANDWFLEVRLINFVKLF